MRHVTSIPKQGLHTANMGGMWSAIVLGLAGLDVSGDVPRCEPCLPAGWNKLEFHIIHHGTCYAATCTRDQASVHPRP